MAGPDRDEEQSIGRFLRFARLRRDIEDAQRVDDARRRLDLQIRVDALRYSSVSTGTSQWRAA